MIDRKRLVSIASQFVIITLTVVVLFELVVVFSFRYPVFSPLPLDLLRYLHIRFDRQVIQVMPECARYDEMLTYTLRPGQCTFSSREFSNQYQVNSLGLRDDELSLSGPNTVVLGDSWAMGWGVDQNQAFPEVLEKITGERTLNAGISSYGTVRELLLLKRIDLKKLRTLVVQYNQNDFAENRQLIEDPPFLTLSSEAYDRTVESQREVLEYYPGKYSFNILVQLQSLIRSRLGTREETAFTEVDSEYHARIFVAVLENSPVELPGIRVVLISTDADFLGAACERARVSDVKWVRSLECLDLSGIDDIAGARYTLDDHMTEIGHREVARLLAEHLKSHLFTQ